MYKFGKVRLEYDDYYIGESSNNTNPDTLQTDNATFKFYIDTTNYTIDFWYYNDTDFDVTGNKYWNDSLLSACWILFYHF